MGLPSLLVLAFSSYIGFMNTDQTADLIYLSLLGGVLLLSYVLASRTNLAKSAQQAGIWVLIFMGAIAVIGMWTEIEATITPQQTVISDQVVSLPRAIDGHYYITLDVNEVPVRFMVDTGATAIVLTHEDAERIGIDIDELIYLGRASTANGEVSTAPVRLDSMTLGGSTDLRVRAVVNGGEMEKSLLGMSYLNRFESITIRNGELILAR